MCVRVCVRVSTRQRMGVDLLCKIGIRGLLCLQLLTKRRCHHLAEDSKVCVCVKARVRVRVRVSVHVHVDERAYVRTGACACA